VLADGGSIPPASTNVRSRQLGREPREHYPHLNGS
jgi:hypothetical protein